MVSKIFRYSLYLFLCLAISACSFTKFVPKGSYLLDDTQILTDTKVMPVMEMKAYIRQKPNFRTFDLFKVPLFLYSLSGKDSTKWVNRVLRHAGEPPVIYDSTAVGPTVDNLKHMMTNKGFLEAEVTPNVKLKNKRAIVTYDIRGGQPFYISNYQITLDDTLFLNSANAEKVKHHFAKIFTRKSTNSENNSIAHFLEKHTLVKKGDLFDLDVLDQERDRITTLLRRSGYFEFNKDYIAIEADTTMHTHKVDINLIIHPQTFQNKSGITFTTSHKQYVVKDVTIYVDYNPLINGSIEDYKESSEYRKNGYIIKYGTRGHYIKPKIILDNCFISPGYLYDEKMTSYTYSALAKLHILKNISITYKESKNNNHDLHCIVTCLPDKRQGMSTEVGGTYTGGFFGVQTSIGYLHRNLFKGSELFSAKVHGSYEAMTPSFGSLGDNYVEFGGESSLTFPRFIFPFLSGDFKRGLNASTKTEANYTFQRRPGFFTRTILSAGIKYDWKSKNNPDYSHSFDLLNVSYVHVPQSSLGKTFFNSLSPAARYYSFTDQFIMSWGYSFAKTNAAAVKKNSLRPLYSMRGSIETAGNLLAAAAKLGGVQKDSLGSREIFGTRFVQYVRGTFDYSKTYFFDKKNSLAWRVGGGIAYPYGNYKQIPIEKRFFSGGADHVRGWDVQTLGPGSYYFRGNAGHQQFYNHEATDNFYNHSGDMRLDGNIEYRSKLFWIFEMAAFVDAGNVWTLRDYPDQPGGCFRFNKFYKQIALAWGLGLRLDFNFVLLRLDCGWKAYDPSDDPNVRRWPITQPFLFKKNVAWHIAVGYPF